VRELAAAPDRMRAQALADALDTTTGFVPQVVGPLVKAGWVRSDPGPTGGYELQASLEQLSVLDIIEAVDGPTDDGRCVVADVDCDAGQPCVLHDAWASARHELTDSLRSMSISSLELRARR
jgi:Rrf2 family protein